MNQPESSDPTQRSKEELLKAYNEVVDSAKQKNGEPKEDLVTASPPKKLRRGFAVVGALAYIGLIYMWVGKPVWLFGSDAEPVVVNREAALRTEMFLQASAIEDYRVLNGSLPMAVEDATEPDSLITYTRLDGMSWVLTGTLGTTKLTLRSGAVLEAFLGTSLEQLGPPPTS